MESRRATEGVVGGVVELRWLSKSEASLDHAKAGSFQAGGAAVSVMLSNSCVPEAVLLEAIFLRSCRESLIMRKNY